MTYVYQPSGICAMAIRFDVTEDGKVKNVKFFGGCPGNHIGIQNLVEDMQVEKVIEKLEGITCGAKKSSCPDQLAKGLKAYLNGELQAAK